MKRVKVFEYAVSTLYKTSASVMAIKWFNPCLFPPGRVIFFPYELLLLQNFERKEQKLYVMLFALKKRGVTRDIRQLLGNAVIVY